MVRFKITMDSEILNEITARLSSLNTAKSMPATAKAMKEAAAVVALTWKNYAMGKQSLPAVPPMKKPSRDYADGIKVDPIGPFEYEIVNHSKIAEYLEYGTSEIDMKETHTKGPRSRVVKEGPRKGTPYLIVPFRWGTPKSIGFGNVMPLSVHNIVKRYEKTITTVSADDPENTKKTPNASGEMVGRAQYEWGKRLSTARLADVADLDLTQIFNMSNMVRAKDDTGKDRAAGYFTFRVIRKDGAAGSWIKPAMPARHITDGVVREVQEKGEVDDLLDAAFRRDLGL
jgi:hypothetical protein